MTGSKSWWERPSAEWLSVAGAVAIGPLFLLSINRLDLGNVLVIYFLFCMVVIGVPLLVAIGGRLRFAVWQLAVASLTVSGLAHHLLFGNHPAERARELARAIFISWLVASVLTAPLPIALLLEHFLAGNRRLKGNHGTSIARPGL
jgi:hypothetical protein